MWYWLDRITSVHYKYSRADYKWHWNDCYGWGKPSKSLTIVMWNAICEKR